MSAQTVRFGDVVRSLNETVNPSIEHNFERVIGLEHLDPGESVVRRWDELASLHDGTSFRKVFRKGQVLFGKRRAYQRKVARADFDGICSGDILVFEPSDGRVMSEFLLYVVQSDAFFAHALQTSSGSLSPRTRWEDLSNYEFELPSLADQARIVELISAIDTHIDALQHQLTMTQQARKSVLHDRLTAGGKDWVETTLGEIADFINGYPFKPKDLGIEGTPVIRIKQLLDPNETVDRSTVNVPESCVLRDGEIVFSWSGTLAVRVWNRGIAYLNQHLFRVIEKPGVSREWLRLVIDDAIPRLVEISHGTTMKHVTKQSLLPFRVLLPPLYEQDRTAREVSEFEKAISQISLVIASARELRHTLLNSELT